MKNLTSKGIIEFKEIKDKLKDFDEITLLRKQTWNVVFHIQSELKW